MRVRGRGLLDCTALLAIAAAGARVILGALPSPVAGRPGHDPDLVVQRVYHSPHVRPALRVGVPGCDDQLLQLLHIMKCESTT